nr:3-hydroxybutyrate oligomer hydrolase family protein [Actinokineospora bangkokensis]
MRLTAAVALVAGLVGGSPAAAGTCSQVRVPGAAEQRSACLSDLTTTGTSASGHTVPADWAGLTPAGLPVPGAVPGVQVDGYFPDSSTTNTNNGWAHDSQFVLRLPERWNGGLVVSGSPGTRRQYANDRAISDHALAAGYAFAATDKGNTGLAFYTDGTRPGDALVEWNDRVTQLTVAAKAAVAHHYGTLPRRTLAAGLSNGGYLVRWQLENRPWLYDGGVDWEGTLWTTRGPNLLTFLPPALRGYQSGTVTGFPEGSRFLWDYHHKVYWDLTQRIYREELDPTWDGPLHAGVPFCTSGTPTCDADYDYASRPRAVHAAVSRIALTGRIGKPLITLHGTLDALLPIDQDSDTYAAMVKRKPLHRYYRVEAGTHVDALYDTYPDKLRPIAPCFLNALDTMGAWLDGVQPPPSRTIPRGTGDLATTCSLG